MATPPDLTNLRARMKREMDIATKRRSLDAMYALEAEVFAPTTSSAASPEPRGTTREELAVIVAEETTRTRQTEAERQAVDRVLGIG